MHNALPLNLQILFSFKNMNQLSSKSKSISHILLSQSPFSRLLFISLFNTSSSLSQNYLSSSPSRRHDEESKNVRVSVWWDIENCQVQNGVNVFKVTHSITSAVRANGIKGPVQVTAFGDVFCLSRANQEALSSTGVNLVHIPHGGKNSADRSLLVDLMYWVSQNPPPAHIFLISGDRDFAGILHKLRMNNYNILLAGQRTPGVLCSAASIMWQWNELAKGENLSGRHFNQPPDGPYNSWYGYYKGPLEDPFDISDPQSCSVADISTNVEPSSESKYRPVPLAILRQIRRIVNAYPDGVSITELRLKLKDKKVPIDKTFYGYKKFSRFLQSMPHIIEVDNCCVDGQFFVRPVSPRVQGVREAVKGKETSVGSMTDDEKSQDVQLTRTPNGQPNTGTRMVDVEPQLPVSPYVDCRERAAGEVSEKKVTDAHLKDNQVALKKELLGKETEVPRAHKKDQNSKSDVGLFKRLWTYLLGDNTDAEKMSNNMPFKLDISGGNPEESNSTNQYGVQPPAHSSSRNASNDNQQQIHPSSGAAFNDDAKSNISDESEAGPGFVTRVISCCKSWRSSPVRAPTEQFSQETSYIDGNSRKRDDASHSRKHELFSKDNFWSALQSFFRTRKGSEIVLNSTSRVQFAEKLQKDGPLILRSFQETDLHHLLDLLVSEKKWIVEFPTKNPRFRIVHPPMESSVEFKPQNLQLDSSTGLSSIFTSSSSQRNHQSRISSALQTKPSEKSRSEVLADCQKLLGELISQYPDGFNLGCLKNLFLEKYGYSLDHQKLGYPKLASLLQIMPGVKIEHSYVFSDKVAYSPGIKSSGHTEKLSGSGSDSDASDSSRKNEDVESPWEELGPVAKQERESTVGQVDGDYDDEFSDDECSELEEDTISSHVKEDGNRSRENEEDSSLLQILDSWYSTKDESSPPDHDSQAKGLVDCPKQKSELSESSNTGIEVAANSAANHARKQKPQKSYQFVSDPIGTKKDKLIDGILGSLKKSGESRIQE